MYTYEDDKYFIILSESIPIDLLCADFKVTMSRTKKSKPGYKQRSESYSNAGTLVLPI